MRRRKRFSTDAPLPDTAGPDACDHLPLKEAVYHLPEDLRAVIILRFFGGYTQAETALALDIPQGTVATRQRKALELLLGIYESAATGKPVRFPLSRGSTMDYVGRFDR